MKLKIPAGNRKHAGASGKILWMLSWNSSLMSLSALELFYRGGFEKIFQSY